MKNGDVFSGVFVGSIVENHESAYLLKMVQHVKSEEKCEANGIQECTGDYIGVGEDHAMSFDIKEVVDLAVEGVAFDARDKPQNGMEISLRQCLVANHKMQDLLVDSALMPISPAI